MDFPHDEDYARITIAAAGEAGGRIAARLGSLIANVVWLPDTASPNELRGAIAAADMAIIVSGLEDAAAAGRAALIAALARESERCQVTVALVTESSVTRSNKALTGIAALRHTVDAFFPVSPDCLVPLEGEATWLLTPPALEAYLVRLQAADLVRIITERGPICVDFADVRAIMREGRSAACLGIGIANGENAARDAALKALRSLETQRLDPGECRGFLVSVTGSTNITMDDFDEAARVVHAAFNEEDNIMMSLLADDSLAGNVRVMIMAKVHDGVGGRS